MSGPFLGGLVEIFGELGWQVRGYRLQKALIKEYTLNYNGNPNKI